MRLSDGGGWFHGEGVGLAGMDVHLQVAEKYYPGKDGLIGL